MTVSAAKLAAGLLLLIGVWIAVYWMWEPREPRVTFAPRPSPASAAPLAAPPTGPRAPDPAPPRAEPKPAPKAASPAPTPPRTAPSAGAAPTAPRSEPATSGDPSLVRQAVKPPEFWTYRVNGGETLETISKHFYGRTDYASAIARANPLMDPTKVRAGREIRIPRDPNNIQGLPQTSAKPVPEPAKPAPAPTTKTEPAPTAAPVSGESGAAPAKRTYKIESGDTLSDISQKFYGTSKHFKLIYDANRSKLKNEDDLREGVEIVIPDAPAPKKTAD
jgi:nucleoid-associated protein YgaU